MSLGGPKLKNVPLGTQIKERGICQEYKESEPVFRSV